eukprot:scaffold47090_cov43-Prasinocladus_malaysianus.AAC.2
MPCLACWNKYSSVRGLAYHMIHLTTQTKTARLQDLGGPKRTATERKKPSQEIRHILELSVLSINDSQPQCDDFNECFDDWLQHLMT